MAPTEQFIRLYLNSLRPVADIDTDSVYPLCLEPYRPHSNDEETDHAVAPTVRRLFSRCRHIFGRVGIERHIRSSQSYSTRCPICREPWLGPWEPSTDDSFELDSDPLSEALARRLLQPTHTESDRGGIFTWDNALDTYTGFEDVFGDIQYSEDGPSRVTANVELRPLMEWLQDLQEK